MNTKEYEYKECVECGEEITGERGNFCNNCKPTRIRKHGELEQLLGQGFKHRRLPVGYQDDPTNFGDD
jgi:hypothetical protein